MVFVLSDVRPCRRQVDVTRAPYHGDVAAVGHRSVKHADRRHRRWVRVGLSDDNNPFTGSSCSTTQGGSVHLSVNVNRFSLNTGHRTDLDVGVDQSVSIELSSSKPSASLEVG